MQKRLFLFLFSPILLLAQYSHSTCRVPIVDSNDEQAATLGYGNGNMYENGELFILQNYLKPSDIVFDVGANVGVWSAAAAKIESGIKLFCFEPVPHAYLELCKNLKPSTDNFYNFALSDRLGQAQFYYFAGMQESEASSLYRRAHFSEERTKVMQVGVETLDHFCAVQFIERIDYLKIDTEGGEWGVLKGAENMLSQHQIRALQFEYGGTYPDAGIYLKDVMKLLTKAGYAIFRMSEKGAVHISKWDPSLENGQYANYFAIVQTETPDYELVVFP